MTTNNALINTVDTAAVAPKTAKTARNVVALNAACNQGALKQALSVVGHAVAGKATLPVLSNISVKATDAGLVLQATDLETAITATVVAKVAAKGETTLPAKLLSEFIGNLPNDTINLTLDSKSETTTFVCGRSEANIKGIEAGEWPAVPTGGTATVIDQLPVAALRQAIKQVVFAAGDDSASKPIFQGVLVRFAPNKPVEMFATDGFRFAFKTLDLDEAAQATVTSSQELIIPAKSLVSLDRALSVVGDAALIKVTTTANNGQAIFTTDNVEVVCRLMTGPHVAFERVLAVFKTVPTTAVMDLDAFVLNLKQAQVFSASSAYITKFVAQPVTADAGSVTLSANAAETGSNKTVVDAVITGKAAEFAASSKFMLEALAVVAEKDVKIAFDIVSAAAPAMLRVVGDSSVRLVVMPMQIQG